MTRGYRNNNPLNIEQSKGKAWQGEIRPSQDARFAQFISMPYGYRAAFKLLRNYQLKHGCRVLADFIKRWAPAVENNTSGYIATVAKRAGLTAESLVDTRHELMMRRIVSAMSFVENGIKADEDDIRRGWELFKAQP